jgi:hypothetical protein
MKNKNKTYKIFQIGSKKYITVFLIFISYFLIANLWMIVTLATSPKIK